MAIISSLGTGSGLDLEGILSKLMTVEQLPLTTLAKNEASFQAKLTAYGTFKSALSKLQDASQKLADTATYTAATATPADTSILTASASNGAVAGTYNVGVNQLAQAQVTRSENFFASTAATFQTGTIAISVGGAAATNITIDSGNNTLAGIRDAINAASAGVTASIVDDGISGNYLILSANTTGATAGAFSVTATSTGGSGFGLEEFDDAANPPTQLKTPLDAKFSVNGLAISRSKNTVEDAIPGVTLNLNKAGTLIPDAPLTTQVTVTRNTVSTQTSITSFVTAYNDVAKQVNTLTSYDSANSKGSILTGDSTLRTIQTRFSGLIGTSVSGLSGNIGRLSDIGISVQKDGTLSINSTKLVAALNDTSKDVAGLFSSTAAGNEGIGVRFDNALDSILGSGGTLANRTDGITQSIKDIGKQRTALTLKLTRIEATYRAQFVALDVALSSMQGTTSYLSQQLDYLKALATGVSSSK